ncbi:Helix-turn-helix domain-containing protein [Psychroflexus salarius]|uniref:Helix-turn-helix domain-containing protein n=1 Tax=Psychroflexus salarius TaxID=1155689 RepID=A0A1M4XME9_9FLAO|nr:helix-turn-helix domain-containing protein [Psychroflexus salarius]SHE94566.1 Helix-turn-helix domain-containing protein [Psychroflexus salarius]
MPKSITYRKILFLLLIALLPHKAIKAQDFKAFNNQQDQLIKQEQYATALKLIDSLLKHATKKQTIAQLKLKKSNIFTLLKFQDSAINYLEQSMKLMRQLKDTNNLVKAKTTLGILLNQNNRPQEALKKFKQHYNYIKGLRSSTLQKQRLMKANYNLGLTHYKLKQYDSAKHYLNASLNLALIKPDYYAISKIEGLLAQVNFETDKNWSQHLKKALEASKIINDSIGLLKGYLTKSEFYLNQNQITKSKDQLLQAKAFIKNSTNLNLKINFHKISHQIYRAENDLKNSLIALEHYNSLTYKLDSILDKNNISAYNERLKYFSDRLKTSELLLQKERKIRRLGLLTSILFILTLGFLATYLIKRNNLKNSKKLFNLNRVNTFEATKELEVNAEKQALFEEVKALLVEQELFLKQDLSIAYVAKQLKSNSTYISEVINLCSQTNFRGYVNRLRINYAKQLITEKIADGLYVNFEDISDATGFKSKSSFYRVFKQITELTPKEFLVFSKNEH